MTGHTCTKKNVCDMVCSVPGDKLLMTLSYRLFKRGGHAETRKHKKQNAESDALLENGNDLVRARTQFLRNFSHQIDTDVIHRLTRSSSKFREITDKTTIPDFVSTVFDVGEEYGVVLSNVLRYCECVGGKFKTVDGPMLIRNVVADANTDAKQKMLRVSNTPPLVNVDITHDVPISEMIGDGPVIKECLEELVFNGLRHDNHAHVSVHVSSTGRDPCHITFTVENKGIQIPDDDLVDIFTPFHSIHRGIVHGSGLGLGLARCKRLARELGGGLHVQNGRVTRFSLSIPIKHRAPIELPHQAMAVTFGRRSSETLATTNVHEESDIFQGDQISADAEKPSVLVVDDSAIARRQFQKMLQYVDVDVDVCEGPLRCLEMIKVKAYDIVCLDIIMPVMSGVTCAYQVREGDTDNKSSPIIIITADNSIETRQLCACIPNSTVLEKPAKRNVLFRTIMSSMAGLPQKEWIRRAWRKKNGDYLL